MIVSAIWSPTVSTGLRLVIGSWKIIEILLPRIDRICGSPILQQVLALEVDVAALDAAGRHGDEPHDR